MVTRVQAQPVEIKDINELKALEAKGAPAPIEDPRIPDSSDTAAIEDFIKDRFENANLIFDRLPEDDNPDSMSAVNVQHSEEYIEDANQDKQTTFDKIYQEAIERITKQDEQEHQDMIKNRQKLAIQTQNEQQQKQWRQEAPNFPVVNVYLPPHNERVLAPAQEHIPFFFSEIEILPTGQVSINETVVVIANGQKLRHGLTRALPLYAVSRDGREQNITINLNQVSINDTIIPYKVKTLMADVGEEIFVLGYPMTTTMGDEIKLTTGVVSSRTGFQGDVSLYQISAPIQPGNSGGPLFDSQGNLIGIVSAKHTGAENVGYAIKASYLRNLMESSITEDVLPTNNSVSSLPLTGKVKKIKDFVYFIECSSKSNGISANNNQNTSSYMNKDGMTHYSSNTFSYRTKAKTCRIDEIVSTPENLKITFTYMNPYPSGSCRIHPDTKIEYMSEEGNKVVKYMEGCVNIPKYPERHNMTFREKLTFSLLFPPMPMNTKSFNVIEPGDSDWLFYDIVLK